MQQSQGRVQPTTQVGGFGVNDDSSLETEATVMGAKAVQVGKSGKNRMNVSDPISKKQNSSHCLFKGQNTNIISAKKANRVIQRVTPPNYHNVQVNGVFAGNVSFTETNIASPPNGKVKVQSPAITLSGSVDINRGDPDSQNEGVKIGWVQTLVSSTATGKYKDPGVAAGAGKEERAQLAVAPQPIRDGDAGKKPWYEVNDVRGWNGTNGATVTPGNLYDRPTVTFDFSGEADTSKELYEVVGQDIFKTWLIAWQDGKPKYLYHYDWQVNYSGTRVAASNWNAAGASNSTGSGPGAGSNPKTAVLGDPVANDALKWRWRKV